MTSVAVAEVDGLEPNAEKVLMEPPRDGQKTSDSDSGEMAALRPAESCLPARSVDETPVSRSEKVAWWFTAFAAEPFAAGGLGLFVTSLVEALAAQAGFQTADPTQPCNVGEPGYNCSVKVGSLTVNTSSLVLYTSALGIITQLLIFLSLGPQADFGGRRKIFLLLFAWLGAVSALLFFGATTPEMWPLATIALLFSTIGLGTFVVFNNAFLPILARYDPSVIAAASVGDVAIASSQHEAVLNTLSVHGIAISSTGGFIGIGICVGIVFATGGALTSLAYACGAMGAWWTIFLFLPFFLLRSRPGPPFPAGENALTMGWKRLWQTAKQASKLKTLMWFLAYWFALADATSVISASSVLFAQVNLGFGTQDLVIISLVIPVAVILGAYGFLGLQKLFKLQTKYLLLVLTCGFLILPIWGLAALKTMIEFYILAVLFGFLLGGQMSIGRAAYGEMIPAGMEAEMYSLFAVVDKTSAFIGPLIVGGITAGTGDVRNGFWYILGLLIVALGLVFFVDQNKGREQAMNFIIAQPQVEMEQTALKEASLEKSDSAITI